jgi:hypothetical protein
MNDDDICHAMPQDGEALADMAGCDSGDSSDQVLMKDSSGSPSGPPILIAKTAFGASANPNTLKPKIQLEPMVDPPVRLLCQYDPRWGTKYLKKQKKGKENEAYTWTKSGCHPTGLAMILRWWAEDNPKAVGKLKFPHTEKPDKIETPVQVNQWLWNKVYVPCDKTISHNTICNSVKKITYTDSGMPMKGEYKILSGLTDKKKAEIIKKALLLGPVLINMLKPGHFVLVQGYRDGKIYVCDPGNTLNRLWGKPVKTGERMPPGPLPKYDDDKRGYVSIPEKEKFGDKGTWLSTLIRMESFYFDEKEVHLEWNKK